MCPRKAERNSHNLGFCFFLVQNQNLNRLVSVPYKSLEMLGIYFLTFDLYKTSDKNKIQKFFKTNP